MAPVSALPRHWLPRIHPSYFLLACVPTTSTPGDFRMCLSSKNPTTPPRSWLPLPARSQVVDSGSGGGLPLRHCIFCGLLEPNLVIDLVHPFDRDDMVLPAGFGIALGQHNLV